MTPWVTRILIANVAMFLVTAVFPVLLLWLLLIPAYVPLRPWTLVTYMFLHADLWHLFFNMLALFFFGPRLEGRLGGARFLWLYLLSGFVAVLLSLIFTPFARIIGASGAVFGVLIGFARYWPRERIYIWGVLPVEARWLVVGITVLSLWGGLGGVQTGVAHFAHLGGFLGGYLFLRWLELRSPARKFKRMAQPAASTAGSTDLARWQGIRRDGLHPINLEEVDRLIKKIDDTGVESLTPDERALLDRFSVA